MDTIEGKNLDLLLKPTPPSGKIARSPGRYARAQPGPHSTLYPNLTANRTLMGNIVFRPRTYLLFSLEYRKIETWQVTPPRDNAQTFGLAIGYLF